METLSGETDSEVLGALEEAMRGDRDAITWLYNKDKRYFIQIFMSWGLLYEDAQDAYQKLWIYKLERLRRFDPKKGRFKSWLAKKAKGLALDFHRHAKARPVISQQEDTNSTYASYADDQISPARLDMLEHLQELIAQLSSREQAMVADFCAGYSHKSIADRHGAKKSAVDVFFWRLQKKLKPLLLHHAAA